MIPRASHPRFATPRVRRPRTPQQERGSILIIVLWIAFGLVTLALYFAHSMRLEFRAADQRLASTQAEFAARGAATYVSNVLATAEVAGAVPEAESYLREDVAVGEAAFWLLGRDSEPLEPDTPFFGLVDEASKLNLNTATAEMLQWLPRMTPELAAAIIDWRDSDDTPGDGGAEVDLYQRLDPPYRCKNSSFESVDELRLVYGMTMELLDGEDANHNGTLDLNENDGDLSAPVDNRDGRLDPGLLEYLTVYTREPTTRTNGEPRIALRPFDAQQLAPLFQEKYGADRANQVLQEISTNSTGFASLLEFYVASGLSDTEFAEIEGDLTTSTNTVQGLVNVNTASETVLACLPGIGTDLAPTLVSYRRSNVSSLDSVAWVVDAIGATNAVTAGPYLTGRTYQFTADVAAVGHQGRGYHREKFVFDTAEGTPRIVYRQDLTHLGWALGRETRNQLLVANQLR